MLQTLTCAALLATLSVGLAAQQTPVSDTRALLRKRAETWQIITKEKNEWRLGRELLQERIGMAQRETAALREKSAEADKNITEADRKNDDLTAKHAQLEAASRSLVAPVTRIEKRVLQLLPRLPSPLRKHVRLMSQRIPTDPENVTLGLGVRFGNVVAILQEVDKWNRVISLVPELQDLGDGVKAEVTVLYLGIGQGYYVSADDQHAGVGSATEKGWVWQKADDAAPRVREAIEIYQKSKAAAFVQLPVRVQ